MSAKLHISRSRHKCDRPLISSEYLKRCNGLILNQDEETLVKLRGARYLSYPIVPVRALTVKSNGNP
jgi:hypothetical protein